MTWEDEQKQARDRRASELPAKWTIPEDKLPQSDTESVVDFPTTSGYLSAEEVEITEHDVPTLLGKIASGEYTSEQVAVAYCHRAAIAHQLTNCLSVMMFDRAIADAKKLDEYYQQHGKTIGPLHGLPVSIKDQHHIKGTPAGCGFVYWSNEVSDQNSATVQILLDLGAVMYVKTTVPLAMMAIETDTRVYGITSAPQNRSHSAGGSSGGEGSLTALGGSPIGIGSDIGGSIRIPASNNGIFGFKPTADRYPTAGQRNGVYGQSFVRGVTGPMARSMASIEHFTNVLLNAHPELYDNKVIPLQWKPVEEEPPKKLAFGIVYGDGFVRVSSGVRRALDETAAKLKAAGHEVVDFTPPGVPAMFKAGHTFFTADGAESIKTALKDEPLMDHLKHAEAMFVDRPNSETWAIQRDRMAVEEALFKQWQATKEQTSTGRPIDAVIAPTSPLAGIQHKRPVFYHLYTAYWNFMDYPGVSFPVTSFDAGKGDADNYQDIANNPGNEVEGALYKVWDPKAAQNGQIGLQLLTARFQDEYAVQLAKLVTSL